MNTKLTWAGGAAFIGESENGRTIVMDGPPEGGGRNLGPRPMETLLLGMGACTAYDVLSILKNPARHQAIAKLKSRRSGRASTPKYSRRYMFISFYRRQYQGSADREGNQPVRGEILFRVHHAGEDCEDYAHL